MNKRWSYLFNIATYSFLCGSLYYWYSAFSPVLRSDIANVQISDFAYYLAFVREFWFGGLTSIYSLDAYLQVLPQFLVKGSEPLPMPLAVTPVVLFLWAPFSCLSFLSFELAQAAWVAVSLQLFFSQLFWIGAEVLQRKVQERVFFYLLLLPVVFSFTFVSTIVLGQTSIFAAGALMYFARRYLAAENTERDRIEARSVLLLVCLAIKPHYFALALGLVLLSGRWRVLCLGVALSVLTVLLLSLRLEALWYTDYLGNMRIFASGAIPKIYLHAFAPESMNLFVPAFSPLLGTRPCILLANTVLFLIFGMVFAYAFFWTWASKRSSSPFGFYRALSGVLLLLGAYLLFAPYAGTYEDLLLSSAVFMLLVQGGGARQSIRGGVILSFLLSVLLNHNLFPDSLPLFLFWLLKLLFFCYLLSEIFQRSVYLRETGRAQ